MRSARLVWWMFADDALGLLATATAASFGSTRLALGAVTATAVGLVAPPRVVILHVVATGVTAALVLTADPDPDHWLAAGIVAIVPPAAVALLRPVFTARELALVAAAHHDPLTGLLNRRGLEAWVAELPTTAAATVIILDIDGLRALNNAHGHARGDDALRRTSAGLAAQLRPGQEAARIGGDEFLLVATYAAPADSPSNLPGSMAERVHASVLTQCQQAGTTVSAGAARGTMAAGLDALVATADAALLRAKAIGGGKLVVADVS